ncbi:MAG TPA: sialidase family protein [Candidatus Latescibacteria bacterium]|nr:sialidase family protein [Candidatus Latescibacterota bacterium]HJP33713.1 sialidase family protein [Candidatus Latescibacterota bacterium]
MTEAYLRSPRVILDPGPEYADSTRQFQGIPGIERATSGRLWSTWYGGRGPGEDHLNHVLLATSDDDGDTWSSPCLIVDPDGDGPTRAYDPCLWHDPGGRLWLLWAQGYEKHADAAAGVWAITTTDSDDERPSWSTPRRLCDGIMMNKPVVASSGRWLIAAARWRTEGSCVVFGSDDDGASWQRLGAASVPEEHRSCDEHMLVERLDGSQWMLVRTTYGIGESTSTDGGHSWSPVQPTALAHPVTRFFIRRLASTRLLLVKHGPLAKRTERSHLTAYLSDDDGLSWQGGLLLDERTGVSYPDGVEAAGGSVFLTYDYDRRGAKQILMTRFSEDDVLAGGASSAAAAMRVVNQAAGGPS